MRNRILIVAAMLVWCSVPAFAQSQYSVTIDTTALKGTAGALVFDLTHTNAQTNVLSINNFAYDGTVGLPLTQGGLVTGDIILGVNPAPKTTISESFFLNELLLPFTKFGTMITFSVQLDRNMDPSTPPDEFSFFVLGPDGQSLTPTTDPLLANALFTICADGSSTGLLATYSPAVFTAPTSLNVVLKVAASAAGVVNVVEANSTAGVGQSVSAGSFDVSNKSTGTIMVSSGVISQSDSTRFSALTLSAVSNGTPLGAATGAPGATTTFSFQPPVTIALGAAATFSLTGTINPNLGSLGLSTGGSSSQSLTLLSGSNSQGSIAFDGLPASLGIVSVGSATATPTPRPTPTAVPTPTPVAEKLTISPKALNFGKVKVNSSSPAKAVTIKNGNKGKKALPIVVESESTTIPSFSIQNQCVKTLSPGGKCTVTLTFKPTATGKAQGQLMINDNAIGSPQTVKLVGIGK